MAVADAARDLTVAGGWEAVRMADVAQAAGVSRQTVYDEYGGRAGLADAVARREIDRFLAGVRESLHAHGAGPLLPHLTTRPELVLVGATAVLQEWAAAHCPTSR